MKLVPSSCPRLLRRWFAITVLALACVGGLGTLRRVHAQSEEAIAKVKELNQKALTAYENLELDEARKALTEALQICAQEGMNEHPWKARTHVHLGAILVGGFQQKEMAIKQFQRALEIQPEITLTPSLRNPETQGVFDEAKRNAGSSSAPVAPVPTEVPAPAVPPSAPAEPEVKGIYHKPIAAAPVGEKVDVRVRVGKDVSFKRLVLAYRPEGSTEFLEREMELGADGWHSARIPEPATQGGLVQYYIEARDDGGRATASNGSPAEPHVLALGDAALAGLDDASLVEGDDERPAGLDAPAEDTTGLMLAVSVGSGLGYVSGEPEVNSDGGRISFSGVAPTKLGHINLELGYGIKPGLIVSLQVRYQTVSGPTEAVGFTRDANDELQATKFSPATGALAAFGKATWLLGAGSFRPYVSVMGGGGELRHVVDISDQRSDCGPLPDDFDPNDSNTFPNEGCIDTVNSGPLFVGGGGGVLAKVSDGFGFTLGLNVLAGIPRFTLHADLNLGGMLLF